MNMFNEGHAWELGYSYAVRGINNMPIGTWLTKFKSDFDAGYAYAVNNGKWGTYDNA